MAKFAGSSEKAQKWTLRLIKMALYKPGGGLAKKILHILPLPACPEAPTAAAFVP